MANIQSDNVILYYKICIFYGGCEHRVIDAMGLKWKWNDLDQNWCHPIAKLNVEQHFDHPTWLLFLLDKFFPPDWHYTKTSSI